MQGTNWTQDLVRSVYELPGPLDEDQSNVVNKLNIPRTSVHFGAFARRDPEFRRHPGPSKQEERMLYGGKTTPKCYGSSSRRDFSIASQTSRTNSTLSRSCSRTGMVLALR